MSILTEIFGEYPRVKILEAFAENDSDTLFIAGIAKKTGLTKMTVNTHISKLLEENIIRKTKKAGIMQYYQLNEKNPKAKVILNIIEEIDSLNLGEKSNVIGFPATVDDTQRTLTYFPETTSTSNSLELESKTEEKKDIR